MSIFRSRSVALAIAGIAMAATGGPAKARIACDGPYQVVGGQSISTPYCQDNNLAAVAQEYGLRASAAAIRSNPNLKAQVCRAIGADNRVQTACAAFRESSSGRRR